MGVFEAGPSYISRCEPFAASGLKTRVRKIVSLSGQTLFAGYRSELGEVRVTGLVNTKVKGMPDRPRRNISPRTQ